MLWQHEKTSHRLTISEYATLSAKRQALNEIEKSNRDKIAGDVVNSYENSIKEVKDYYAKNPNIKLNTVRVRDNSCNAVSTTRENPISVNSKTIGTNQAIAPTIAREVQINLPIASNEIVQCLELIEFSKKQDALPTSP